MEPSKPENPRITNAQKSHPYQRYEKRRKLLVTIPCLKCWGTYRRLLVMKLFKGMNLSPEMASISKDKLCMTWSWRQSICLSGRSVGVDPSHFWSHRRQLWGNRRRAFLDFSYGNLLDRGGLWPWKISVFVCLQKISKRPLHRNLEHCFVTI